MQDIPPVDTGRSPRPPGTKRHASYESMGKANFEALRRLVAQHSEATSMHGPLPSADQLDALWKSLKDAPYIKGLYEYGEVNDLLKKLEAAYSQYRARTVIFPPAIDDQALRDRAQLFRKTLFTIRIARLIGPAPGPADLTASLATLDPLELNRAQQELLLHLGEAGTCLESLMADVFFREHLGNANHLVTLIKLQGDLPSLINRLKSAPYRPIKIKAKAEVDLSSEQTRILANRIADAAFRLYGDCPVEVLRSLLGFKWQVRIRIKEREAIIKSALETKQDQFGRGVFDTDIGTDRFDEGWPRWPVTRTVDGAWHEA